MMLKKFIILILAVFIIMLCGCGDLDIENSEISETISIPSAVNEFNFSILKVGKADAVILKTENHSVIIDCGEKDDGDEVVKYLADNGIENVDYLFITHFDKDHVGGVPKVIKNIKIAQIVTPDYEGSNDEYENYIKALDENNINPLLLAENKSFVLDDVLFEIFPPQKKYYSEGDNDFSLAVSVTHGSNNFLFAGDAEEIRLSEILNQTDKEYDFLKFPHHGRYNKFTQKFVESIKPKYSVITCSEKNPAEEETIEILENADCKIYYTKDGDIAVKSNGSEITITQ